MNTNLIFLLTIGTRTITVIDDSGHEEDKEETYDCNCETVYYYVKVIYN